MSKRPGDARIALAAVMTIGVCSQAVGMAGRLVLSLEALAQTDNELVVGILLGLFGLLPLFLAVPIGRWIDRSGALPPLLAGNIASLAGLLLPVAWPHVAALFVAAVLIGGGVMTHVISLNNVTGSIGTPAERTTNFGWLALGYSVGLFGGPFVAGFGIDHLGSRATLAATLSLPVATFLALFACRHALPGPTRHLSRERGGFFELLRHPGLRRIFIVGVASSASYELHGFLAPVYGHRLGLSASTIGSIAGALALGVIAVRVISPWLLRRVSEWRLIAIALLVSSLLYAVFVTLSSVPLLIGVSFALGAVLGITQPVSMSLMHAAAPEGRTGEALGLRTMIMTAAQIGTQVSLGALSGLAGLLPVVWAYAACTFSLGWMANGRAGRVGGEENRRGRG